MDLASLYTYKLKPKNVDCIIVHALKPLIQFGTGKKEEGGGSVV